MPTRRGPGRPRSPWRPRKIEQDYLIVSEGRHSPTTRRTYLATLRKYEDFLRQRGVDSDAVTIHDLVAWEASLIAQGWTSARALYNRHVRAYYFLKGTHEPDTKWSRLAAELKVHKPPTKTTGRKHPHLPFPVTRVPKILAASQRVEQRDHQGRPVYNDAYPVTATFIYSGGRAQLYGLRVSDVESALEKKYIETFVKEQEEVFIPIPDQLLAIWKEHLEKRDYDGPMLFRNGRYPYTTREGSKDWNEDSHSASTNENNVERILRGLRKGDGVERALERVFGIKERLTAHRFRKTLSTAMDGFGFRETEIRLQLSHDAANITRDYVVADVLASQKKLSQIDIGSEAWVAAHVDEEGQPVNLFANKDKLAEALERVRQAEERAQKAEERADRMERKLDEILALTRQGNGATTAPLARIAPTEPPGGAAAAVRPKGAP